MAWHKNGDGWEGQIKSKRHVHVTHSMFYEKKNTLNVNSIVPNANILSKKNISKPIGKSLYEVYNLVLCISKANGKYIYDLCYFYILFRT
jgi:hypothetical protein